MVCFCSFKKKKFSVIRVHVNLGWVSVVGLPSLSFVIAVQSFFVEFGYNEGLRDWSRLGALVSGKHHTILRCQTFALNALLIVVLDIYFVLLPVCASDMF